MLKIILISQKYFFLEPLKMAATEIVIQFWTEVY